MTQIEGGIIMFNKVKVDALYFESFVLFQLYFEFISICTS